VIDTESGEEVPFEYNEANHLLTVELAEGIPVAIVVG
jgi:hypothetical protein